MKILGRPDENNIIIENSPTNTSYDSNIHDLRMVNSVEKTADDEHDLKTADGQREA